MQKPVVISLVNTKGGATKTTSSINIASCLALRGFKVLLIDADPMQSLSTYWANLRLADCGFTNVVTNKTFEGAITPLEFGGMDLVFNDDPDSDVVKYSVEKADGAFLLLKAIEELKQSGNYDYVVIDTPPGEKRLIEMAVIASDLVVSPLTLEALVIREFYRKTVPIVEQCAEAIELTAKKMAKHAGFFYEPKKTKSSNQIKDSLIESYSTDFPNFKLIDYVVKSRSSVTEAASVGIPPLYYKHKSKTELREWFDELVDQLLDVLEV